jgi:Holliday junction resolvasome RuvABC endonuclease subunit
MSSLYAGWDQSCNHAGAVLLGPEGEVRGEWFLAHQKKLMVSRPGTVGTLLPKHARVSGRPKGRTAEVARVARLVFLRSWVDDVIQQMCTEALLDDAQLYAVVEDYAHRAAQGAHQLGEVGAVMRLGLMRAMDGDAPIHLRLHGPESLKLFASGKGNAPKEDVQSGIWDQFRVSYEDFDEPVLGDLTDAYALAQMGRLEQSVRAGATMLADLPEHWRKLFLRVTPTNPVNLLARPWTSPSLCASA